MKRTITLLTVVLLLAAGSAMADQCKPINARVPAGDYLGPCSYNGMEFEFCIDTPVRGTLNGTWHYYGPANNGIDWPADYSDPSPFSAFSAGWALDVIETNKGEIFAQDNWFSNWNVAGNKAGFPIVQLSSITGGTGHWEGAWGWFGAILDDAGLWRGYMKGEICVPD